jgi:hypothetical protein
MIPGAKCPQTLPVQAMPLRCNSPLVKKLNVKLVPPDPSDPFSTRAALLSGLGLKPATSTFIFQLTKYFSAPITISQINLHYATKFNFT